MISIVAYVCLVASCLANPTTLRSTQGRYIRNFGPVASRRQAVSYVTNVIHQDPKNPNQMAQSTVNVHFLPSSETNPQIQHYSQRPQQHSLTLTRSQPHSQTVQQPIQSIQQPIQHQTETTQRHQYFQRLPHHINPTSPQEPNRNQIRQKSRQQVPTVQTVEDIENHQSQLFNVGYSVRFKNNPTIPSTRAPPTSSIPTKHRIIDDGEIITGIRKRNEKVDIPDLNTSPQEFVATNLRIRHKFQRPKKYSTTTQAPDTDKILAQANLSPITQKYFQALQQIQATQKDDSNVIQDQTGWKSLSPSVEIYQSTSNSIPNKYSQQEESDRTTTPDYYEIPMQETGKARYFDHESALGRSQGFDYTNVVNMESNSIQNTPNQQTQSLQPQASSQRISMATHSNPQPTVLQPSIFNHFSMFHPQVPNQEVPQLVQTTGKQSPIPLFLPPVTKQIDNAQPTAGAFQSLSKFPVDTTLIREPVLTTDTKGLSNNPNVIPIHFDTRLLQEMQQKLVNYQNTPDHFFGAQSQQNIFTTIPQDQSRFPAPLPVPAQRLQTVFVQNYEPPQLRPAQQEVETKDVNFSPSLPAQPYTYAAHMQIVNPQPIIQNQQEVKNVGLSEDKGVPLGQRTDFKIYGKPQSIGKPSGQEPTGHHLHKEVAFGQRQPRFRQLDHKLRTNLRPPPVTHQHNYQRRLYRI